MNSSLADRARQIIIDRGLDQSRQTRLVVDFYRIRRRIAYPLPVRETEFLGFPTRLPDWYPWDCWYAWAVEERVWSMGWAGTWLKHDGLKSAVDADLRGLAAWRYITPDRVDGLAVAHFVRTMTTSAQQWSWIPQQTREQIVEGLRYLLSHYSSWLDNEAVQWERRRREPDHPDFALPLHNIHYIETVGLCLAARFVQHERAPWLERHVADFTTALLDQHSQGISEGSSYDGYIMDFIASWLADAPPAERSAVLEHPELDVLLAQPMIVGAPGSLEDTARLGDIEPVEMPFHISALAKIRKMRPTAHGDWYLNQYNPSRLRTEALAALVDGPPLASGDAPPAGGGITNTVYVLRSGWTRDDLAVAMSTHACPMGHQHDDNGTLVIAAGGRWLIDDPGYQQYMTTSERDFTLGPQAHNYPKPNGQPQTRRAGTIITKPSRQNAVWHMAADLQLAYDPQPAVCRRYVWMIDRSLIVVADRVSADNLSHVNYDWHGHPDASWWAEDGLAIIHADDVSLWIRCMQLPLLQSQIDRLRGSRGHLTLSVEIPADRSATIWWAFGVDEAQVRHLTLHGNNLVCPGTPEITLSTD